MQISVKFYQKTFVGEDSKETYLEVCKWVAQNVINKVEISETFWNVSKVKNTDLPTFKLELYCMLEESEFNKSFCERCQLMHKSFFINEEYNCNRCNMKAYLKELETKLQIKKQYRKEKINYITGK